MGSIQIQKKLLFDVSKLQHVGNKLKMSLLADVFRQIHERRNENCKTKETHHFVKYQALQNRVAVRDYKLILWGIEDIPYIFHLSISKPLKPDFIDLFIDKIIYN